jgi:hypothetical protein
MRVVATFARIGAWAPSLSFALLLSGCNATVEPIDVGAGCPEQPLRGPLEYADEAPGRLIDDFEDGDKQLVTAAGRDGSWILGWDMSGTPTAENSERCAARGTRAGHFTGLDFESWGTNWTAVFRASADGRAVGYDATRYRAISFWGALGVNAEPSFEMPIGLTTVDVAWNGECDVCMDYYRTEVTLSRAWQRFVVPFDVLAQAGTGDPLTDLNPEELVGFIIWPEHQFDVWIDDVRFEE